VPEFQVKESVDYDVLGFQLFSSSEPLTYIYNRSLTTAIFPERCKLAIVRPIYKKEKKKEISNYRPISPLTVM